VELYRANLETSGVLALVLKPAAEDEKTSVGLNDWRVRFISSAIFSYVPLEVEHAPRSVARAYQDQAFCPSRCRALCPPLPTRRKCCVGRLDA
jgi:hypothetical protein